jgi:hypothetical protein
MVESKFFEKCTFGAAPHGVKSLPPSDTAAGAWFRHQGGAAPGSGAARRQARIAVPHNSRVFFIFLVFHF